MWSCTTESHFFLPFLSFRLLPRPAAGTDAAKLSPRRTKTAVVNRGQQSQNFSAFFPSDEDISMTSKVRSMVRSLM